MRDWAKRASIVSDATIQSALVGPDGYLRATTIEYNGPPIHLGDREHFQAQIDAKTDDVFIGKPVTVRATGQVSLHLTRRLRKPDGSFDGCMAAAIDSTFAEKFHSLMLLSSHSGIVLRGVDGVVRSTHGFAALPNAGYVSKPTTMMSEALASAPQGYYWSGGIVDGIDRLVSYRRVAGHPLIAMVGETRRNVFAEYERHRIIYFAIAIVRTLLALIAITLNIRRQSSFERSKLSLELTNHRFSTVLEKMTHGLCMFDSEKRLVICNERYADLYQLPPDLLKPGTSHQAIIGHRVNSGLLAGERGAGAVDVKLGVLGQMSSDKISSHIDQLSGGRLIRVTRQPMPDGGWVATHEDVTEISSRAKEEKHRAEIDTAIKSFCERVEINMTSVEHGAAALKSITADLSTSSHSASEEAAGAVQASNKAAANVGTAAAAAVELANSILEIDRQLNQAVEVARGAVAEVKVTN